MVVVIYIIYGGNIYNIYIYYHANNFTNVTQKSLTLSKYFSIYRFAIDFLHF